MPLSSSSSVYWNTLPCPRVLNSVRCRSLSEHFQLYVVDVELGSPPQRMSVILDTGLHSLHRARDILAYNGLATAAVGDPGCRSLVSLQS